MKRILHSLFATFILLLGMAPTYSLAQDTWKLRRDKESIQVYTANVEGSPYDRVQATTVLDNIRLSSIVALIEDYDACPDWADRCEESYVHERISDNEALVYTHNDLPFPVKDRDVLSRIIWSQHEESLVVSALSHAENDILPEVRGRLRLTEADVKWTLTPLPSGSVQVTNEAHINPGSVLPGWIVNMLLVDAPFETMKSFRDKVQEEQYQEAEVSFIREP